MILWRRSDVSLDDSALRFSTYTRQGDRVNTYPVLESAKLWGDFGMLGEASIMASATLSNLE
jgi:hypothetical protein